MNKTQVSPGGSPCPRERIVQAAIRLYRAIGYRKTTVADIARSASMSPANIYRFFPSRQAVEEAVVAGLLGEVCAGAGIEARSNVSGEERLDAAFWTICQRHEHRLAHDSRLHELVVAAGQANWPVVLSYGERVRGLVGSIIAAGQASGEFRAGSATALARCTCEAMGAYLDPSRMRTVAGRTAFEEMMSFCSGALRSAAPAQVASQPLHYRATCRA
ncbi:AcrR family transcriptional regulator [Bradyrhizobium sp. CIR48]|uniref:TetR/AcrR family transcriptional regulator n=1 Tax=Bradyrhizobium sp. CIR48 TaxID=2663840 RepID=UPI0016059FFC|nr:TetR family transcriptional regulator [Bradyrhizobium sp. CIR48]MBB4426620.1 AcrR family transcriptional regulator [Bradyrhizobium sp. CIR48]